MATSSSAIWARRAADRSSRALRSVREPGEVRVERLDLLHELELLILELRDPPLQRTDLVLHRLQLAGVADRAAVQGLVVLGGLVVDRRDVVFQALLGPGQVMPVGLDLPGVAARAR